MRLNAYLARAGITSRRKADEFIKAGRVLINGRVGQLNDVVSGGDEIKLDGKPIRLQEFNYILLNKPVGYVTTVKDTHGRPKVTDLVKSSERIVPAGRLDLNTSGALLLTNDGELVHKLTHPSFKVDKVYEAEVDGSITDEILNKLSIGIKLEDGLTAPAKARFIANNKIELTIHEGRNRQVRRMIDAVGLHLIQLHRSKYGPLDLTNLSSGQWRELAAAEVQTLKSHPAVVK